MSIVVNFTTELLNHFHNKYWRCRPLVKRWTEFLTDEDLTTRKAVAVFYVVFATVISHEKSKFTSKFHCLIYKLRSIRILCLRIKVNLTLLHGVASSDSCAHSQWENFFLLLPKCNQFALAKTEGIFQMACLWD